MLLNYVILILIMYVIGYEFCDSYLCVLMYVCDSVHHYYLYIYVNIFSYACMCEFVCVRGCLFMFNVVRIELIT